MVCFNEDSKKDCVVLIRFISVDVYIPLMAAGEKETKFSKNNQNNFKCKLKSENIGKKYLFYFLKSIFLSEDWYSESQ